MSDYRELCAELYVALELQLQAMPCMNVPASEETLKRAKELLHAPTFHRHDPAAVRVAALCAELASRSGIQDGRGSSSQYDDRPRTALSAELDPSGLVDQQSRPATQGHYHIHLDDDHYSATTTTSGAHHDDGSTPSSDDSSSSGE